MKNFQFNKRSILPLIPIVVFGCVSGPHQSMASEETEIKELVREITIVFDDGARHCPIGTTGGSDELLQYGTTLNFHGEFRSKAGVPKYQIGFTPYMKLFTSDKNGDIVIDGDKMIRKPPMGIKGAMPRFTYTIYSEGCKPVDPVIIIDQ